MKLFVTSLLVTLLLLWSSGVFAQTKTDTIQVWGNCGMCKQRIEKAAKKAGADRAKWDMNIKKLIVTYRPDQTSSDEIQKKIASIGHDTEKYMADDRTYNKLDRCCHYQRKKVK